MRYFYEFFAGGGMARAGLGSEWQCTFANEWDPKKGAAYVNNWGRAGEFVLGDVAKLKPAQLPRSVDLAWASFPCQDLSLAGAGAGLKGGRSGTFWPFWRLMQNLGEEQRAPKLIVLENVCGTITSHGGRDFARICDALGERYRFGAVVVDAELFVPQSRPRLFIIGVRSGLTIPRSVQSSAPASLWHPRRLIDAQANLSRATSANWVWWDLPVPAARVKTLAEIIEDEPHGVEWHSASETKRLISLMSDTNLAKLKKAQGAGSRVVGTVYKRTRRDDSGEKVQRAEVRFDQIAGCLRTPTGGSSRQSIMVVDRHRIRSRLLSPREAARLMGLPETYLLPQNYNEAYHLAGDGVAVPAVRFLAEHLLEPVLGSARSTKKRAA